MSREARKWTENDLSMIHALNRELVQILEVANVPLDIACASLHMLATGFANSYGLMTLDEALDNYRALWADVQDQKKRKMS